jgi:TRAP-type C4-dicarboxylate transport system substrate-binding protein
MICQRQGGSVVKIVHAVTIAVALLYPVAAPLAETAQLRFAYPGPPNTPYNTKVFTPWAEDVTKASGGTVAVKIFTGPTLATNQNVYDRIIAGVADIGFGVFGPLSSQFPQANVATLPFESRDQAEAAEALWRLYDKGVISGEFGKVKVLALMVFPGLVIHAKKPIQSLADIKGMKISVEGRVLSAAMEQLGAVPISLTPGELYESLQRGMVEAAPQGWPSVPTFHLTEVTSYHLEVPIGMNTGFVFMNKEDYARLPQQGQQAIDGASGEAYVRRLIKAGDEIEADARNATKAMKGQTVAALAPDEEARWKDKLAPITEAWVKETPDGAKVLAAFRAEISAIRAGK